MIHRVPTELQIIQTSKLIDKQEADVYVADFRGFCRSVRQREADERNWERAR
jgi:hypothetical protein